LIIVVSFQSATSAIIEIIQKNRLNLQFEYVR